MKEKKFSSVPYKIGKPLFYAYCISTLFFLIMPLFIVLPISFSSSRYLEFPPAGFSLKWYDNYFSSRSWLSATRVSLEVAGIVTVLASIFGTLASFAFVRMQFRGKGAVYSFMISPMMVPLIIIAICIYFLFAHLHLIGTVTGLVIAHTILATPFVIVNVSATLKGLDLSYERAAMNLGATPFKSFWYVVFPMIRPGILSGAIFAFATSFDELVIALFISGSTAVTLPRMMWDGIRMEINPTIAAVSSLLIGISATFLIVLELTRKRNQPSRT
ncbi:MAG: ABC transporter permease [Deltaproteobacteria bacterium]|nr:ABC transporter permease [Deltaproteobacteria bacterium]